MGRRQEGEGTEKGRNKEKNRKGMYTHVYTHTPLYVNIQFIRYRMHSFVFMKKF